MTTETPTETYIKNPVLRGFNPDPSILRVGDDYYLATSTFEWFPGVQIHHSKNLVNWNLIARPLDQLRLLDMTGNVDSGGIWAPCLSYSDGLFFLIYTNMRSWDDGPYKVCYNYLTTASDIQGPWSDAVFLSGSGFDPSLFHDSDGRKWLLNQLWDHRPNNNQFAGIVLQEYCPESKSLIGPVKNIFKGTEIALVEGPHLYKRNGYYYLLTAEGGTEYNHAATLARSRTIQGPYELHPQNPILTTAGLPDIPLQKAGHASMVQTPEGEWYLAHLCGRPIDGTHCILGRETAIQKLRWRDDDWPELDHGGSTPAVRVPAPRGVVADLEPGISQTVKFDCRTLNIHFQALRRPITDEWLSLTANPGRLRLYGQEMMVSKFKQSLLARRIQAFKVVVETCLHFDPPGFQQMAGLIAYYNTQNHYYLRVSRDEMAGKCLNIIRCDAGDTTQVLEVEVPLPEDGPVYLGLSLDVGDIQFRYSTDGDNWKEVGPSLSSRILSDDYQTLGFTGAFAGICAQDATGMRFPADFEFFSYAELG